MSGPKSSVYDISEERRRNEEERRRKILEEEERKRRLIEEEACQRLLADILNVQNEIKAPTEQLNQYEQAFNELNESINHALHHYPSCAAIREVIADCRLQAQNINLSVNQESHSSVLKNHLDRLNKMKVSLENQLSKIPEKLEIHDQEVKRYMIYSQEKAFMEKANSFQEQEVKSFNIQKRQEKKQSTNHEYEREVSIFLEQVQSYLIIPNEEIHTELTNLIKSIKETQEDSSFSSDDRYKQFLVRKRAFLSSQTKYDQILEFHKKKETLNRSMYNKYESICSLLEEVPDAYESFHGKTELLEKEIALKQQQLTKKENQKLITNSINEVMSELGYKVLVSENLHSAKREMTHHIYEYKKGNVINSFTGDDGSILFEVTGVKEINQLSSLEKLKIKEGMDDFCQEYEEIKAKLENRGIKLALEKLKPADVRYARAVNVDEIKRKKKAKRSNQTVKPNLRHQ